MDLFRECSDFDLKLADDCEVHVNVGREEETAAHTRLHRCLPHSSSHFYLFIYFKGSFPPAEDSPCPD